MGTTKKILLSVKDLKKTFGKKKKEVKAIKGVSFDIYHGEHVSLVGANGAGKTTMVEILAGLNKQDSGTVNYFFQDGTTNISKNIGIQFQDSLYPAGLSVKRIISFIMDAYGSKTTKTELKKLLKVFGVQSFYHHNAKSLSGGQSQRLNILLALLHNPQILFLDELSTGLDITIRNQIKIFIKEYANVNNMNIILVSHDMNEVEFLAERVIVMSQGKIIDDFLINNLKKKKISLENYLSQYI